MKTWRMGLALVALLCALLVCAVAGAETRTGTCGENLTWTLEDDGTLTISGEGNMNDYTGSNSTGIYITTAPWGAEITHVTIEDNVTSIGSHAFTGCSILTSIIIPDSVTSIGGDAFHGCSSLTGITIPGNVTSIDFQTFANCSSLTSITIPDRVTNVGGYAFTGCSSLTSITIPDSLISIGSSAFDGCSNLTSITIPDGVTSIHNWAFSNCSATRYATLDSAGARALGAGGYSFWESDYNLAFKYIYNNNEIMGVALEDVPKDVTTVIIPSFVTSIGSTAFYGCSNLISITIPDSVTNIGSFAFLDCSSLTSITIPGSVTSIGISAFSFCSSLTSITIPDSVISIGGTAFTGCTKLVTIEYHGQVISLDGVALCGDTGSVHYLVGNNHHLYLYGDGVMNGYSYSSSAPWGTGITHVTIEDGVTSIGNYAFYNCSSMTSITIPDSVTSIGMYAFSDCEHLAELTLPNPITQIGAYAMNNCSGLTSLRIPASVTEIADTALSGCSNVTIYCADGSAALSFAMAHDIPYIIDDTLKTITFTLPADLTAIESEAFAGMTQGFNLVITDRVTAIADDAFSGARVVFICPDGSYAAQYAEAHSIPHKAEQ